jgi:hypothetical protein
LPGLGPSPNPICFPALEHNVVAKHCLFRQRAGQFTL